MAAIIGVLSSCTDSFDEVSTPKDFAVSTEKDTYKVGEKVVFNISGDVDFINFFSGEEGSDYAYHDKDRIYEDEMMLSFSTAQYPANSTNIDCARLLYSNDFPAVYEEQWVKLSTWIDITDKVNYPRVSDTNYVLYDTEGFPLADLFDGSGLPLYFCWEFVTEANSQRTRFRVDNWQIYGKKTGKLFYSFVDSNFQMIQGSGFALENSASYYPRVTSMFILWDGVWASTVKKEGWAISDPIELSEAINAGHDRSISIKTIGDPVMRAYNYYFETPGTYTVTFEAINANANGQKSVTAQKTITIEKNVEEGDEDKKETVILSGIENNRIVLSKESLSAKFNLQCADRWSIEGFDTSWLTVSPVEGSAEHIYTVTVAAADNGTAVERSTSLAIISDDKRVTIDVTQGI